MAAAVSTSLDAFLEERPLPLVALVGSQDLHCALTTRKPAADELHARYLSLPEDTAQLNYAGSTSDEGSASVLKRGWLHKHTYVVAPVLSLWFLWEADTPMAPILARLESFRTRVRPSCTSVLVLVSKSGAGAALNALAAPAKDDERASALRKAAELDSRSVLSLTLVDSKDDAILRFEETSVRRVERALLEAALNYYKDDSRSNKKMKASGRFGGGAALLARHHFKRAYYSEVRRDAASAAKHWQTCSGALLDLLRLVVSPPSEAERPLVKLAEVKRIAEFVNRKMLATAFESLRITEACEAFRKHMRTFRQLVHVPPPPGSASSSLTPVSAASVTAAGHVHWGWLGKQYRMFARLLEAVGASVAGAAAKGAATGVHPQYTECGYYYQAAASCALERRKCAEKLIAAGALAAAPATAAAAESAEDPLGAAAAAAAAAAAVAAAFLPTVLIDGMPATLVALELGVVADVSVAADSGLVIELLTKAYEQFKQSRQLRMILFLAAQVRAAEDR